MLNVAIIGISGFGEVHYYDLMRQTKDGKIKIVAAMQAGAHSFIEKPAAATIQEINAMQACEKETAKCVYVGFQHIYQKVIQDAKQLILSRKLGKLLHVKALCLWPRNYACYNRNKWARCLKHDNDCVLDSPFNNATSHFLNIALFWSETEFSKSAEIINRHAELYKANDIQSPDTKAIHLQTASGSKILYYCTHASKKHFGPQFQAVCEEGTVHFSNQGVSVEYNNSVTEVINAVHDSTEIQSSPAEYCASDTLNDSPITKVIGIEDVFKKCFQSGKMPSGFDIKWANKTSPMQMKTYNKFKGDKIK
ncbi:MAG: Gfo/Idh/MocA family oxidoreductase [Lentisphaerae bacterium]|nr:Gfo/Idh/MocA family oxidoreductase [Lentisphaerota bacterium]MCP4101572.1 Gfo/Idh/MocA family oxidoreductase [Lentisphaerota bacterium]